MGNTKRAESGHDRRGALPRGVTVEVRAGGRFVTLIYLGTQKALVSTGCLTRSMLARRRSFRQGDSRGLRDELGQYFNLHRLATKAEPGRMKLKRRVSPQFASQLPGVGGLYPEGLPEAEQVELRSAADADDTPTTAKDWQNEQILGAGTALIALNFDRKEWRGLGASGPRFRFADNDVQRLEKIIDKFREEISSALHRARVIDVQASPRSSFLRLVIDNTQEIPNG